MSKKIFLFISFSISAIVFFAWMLNQKVPPISEEQKEKALKNILGRDVREEKNIPQGEKTYQGKYFSLSYPAYAKVYDRENTNITANKKILEYFRLDSEEPKFKFVIMVANEDSTAVLDELSGVRIRRQNKLYKEQPLTIDGNTGLLFIKESDGVERSSFFVIEEQSYSFSIIGIGVDANELEEIYAKIMNSVKF